MADNEHADISMSTVHRTRKNLAYLQKMKDKGEKIACLEARKYLSWYLRGVPYAAYAREKISRVTVPADVEAVIDLICREL